MSVYVEINMPRWLEKLDFDQKSVRKVILKEAREVRKIARRLVARRALSNAGEFPGRETGALMRSIKVFGGRGKSMFAVIRPHKTAEMEIFYPKLLLVGSKARLKKLAPGEGRGKSNRRGRDERVKALAERAASDNYIIEPRANYMEEAMNRRRYAAREAIEAAVKASIGAS